MATKYLRHFLLSINHLFLVLGSPGGSTIITTVAQIILNVIDFNMSIDKAVESKRFHHQWLPPYIQLEQYALPYDVINNLKNKDQIFVDQVLVIGPIG